MFLWTVSAPRIGASLYRANGFTITEESTRVIWGATLTEQRYDLVLTPEPQHEL